MAINLFASTVSITDERDRTLRFALARGALGLVQGDHVEFQESCWKAPRAETGIDEGSDGTQQTWEGSGEVSHQFTGASPIGSTRTGHAYTPVYVQSHADTHKYIHTHRNICTSKYFRMGEGGLK